MKPANPTWVKSVLDSFSRSFQQSGFTKTHANQNGMGFMFTGETKYEALIKMREVNKKHLSVFSVIKDDPKKMEFTYWLPLPVSTEEFTVVMRLDSKTIYVDLKRTEKKSQPER